MKYEDYEKIRANSEKIKKLNDHFNRLLPYFEDKDGSGNYDETAYNAFIEDLLFGTDEGSNPDPDKWINEALSPQGFASMIGPLNNLFSSNENGGKAAPRWACVPRCMPPQQILSLHVKCAAPQF